jgi:hypothetical protein
MPVVCLFVLQTATTGHAAEIPFSAIQDIPMDSRTDLAGPIGAIDFDDNGYLDIVGVTESYGRARLIFWYNDPPWKRDFIPIIDAGLTYVYYLKVADIDGNGEQDIGYGGQTGLGAGIFIYHVEGLQRIAICHEFSDCMELADIDGDRDLDVIGGFDHVYWWENPGVIDPEGDAWTRHEIGYSEDAKNLVCASGDLDGDGDMDVISTFSGVDNVMVWWENLDGHGGTWLGHNITSSYKAAYNPKTADIDLDGDLDIVAAPFNGGIQWWENSHGTGLNWAKHPVTTRDLFNLDLHDMDLDGDMDILATAYNAGGMYWFENMGGPPPEFTTHILPSDTEDHYYDPLIADFDRDGDPDIVYRTETKMRWLENETIHRNAWFPSSTRIKNNFHEAGSVRTADINGDGIIDVIGAAYHDGDLKAWLTLDRGSSMRWEVDVDLNISGIETLFPVDLDQDGDIDILGAASLANTVCWWENNGDALPKWTKRIIASNFKDARDAIAADLDGDGDPDVAALGFSTNQVAWWENDGTPRNGGWIRQNVSVAFAGGYSLTAGDLDGDGDQDLIGAAWVDNEIMWWENMWLLGTHVFWPWSVTDSFSHARAVTVADIDMDDRLDIVAVSYEGELAWWENQIADPPTWTRHQVTNKLKGAISIQASDMDMDGDIDLITGEATGAALSWWENRNRLGTLWQRHDDGLSLPGARNVWIDDLDQDGDPDILAAAGGTSDCIQWWPNLGGQFALSTKDVGPNYLYEGCPAAIMAIDMIHQGRPGDHHVELNSIDLLLESTPGNPLSQAQCNALIDRMQVYSDNGNLRLGAGDTLVGSFSTPTLNAGGFSMTLPDGDVACAVPAGDVQRFFLTIVPRQNASLNISPQFMITHRTESTSSAEDRTCDLPVALEFCPDFASDIYRIRDESRFRIISAGLVGTDKFGMKWPDLGPGWAYTVQYRPWMTFSTWWSSSAVAWPIEVTYWEETGVMSRTQRYYRVLAEWQP